MDGNISYKHLTVAWASMTISLLHLARLTSV